MVRRRKSRRLPDSIVIPRRFRHKPLVALAIMALAAFVAYDRSIDPRSSRNAGSDQNDRGGRTERQQRQHDLQAYHDRSFRVIKVVDGDTLHIDAPDEEKSTTTIRLLGVDTPELGHGRGPDMHFGAEARDFAARALDSRNVHVVLNPDDTRDKYGRLLAYLFVERGGAMFNEMLLEEGLAYADTRFPHPYSERFIAAEQRSRRSDSGLWNGITTNRMPDWRRRLEGVNIDEKDR